MKKLYFVVPLLAIALASAFLLSCRKETLRIIDDPAAQGAASCSNGIYDGDEQDLDCGGSSCAACTALTPPCSPSNQSLSINSVGNFSYSAVYHDSLTYSWYEINCYSPDMRIKLGTMPGNVAKAYYIDPAGLDANDAQIYINSGFSGTYNATSGKLYVKRVNGKVEVTFCSVALENTQSSSFNTTGSGKVTVTY